MLSKLSKLLICMFAFQLLASCASSGSSDFFERAQPKDYTNMYLRGVFNWWEIDEAFKLMPIAEDEYAVTFELIADGQPYDFKVADVNWSMTLNCGNAFEAEPIELNQEHRLVCAADSLNLQFTPSETSLYRFILDVSSNASPELKVVKVD